MTTQQRRETIQRFTDARKWAQRLSNPRVPLLVRESTSTLQLKVLPELTPSIDMWLNTMTWAHVVQREQSDN